MTRELGRGPLRAPFTQADLPGISPAAWAIIEAFADIAGAALRRRMAGKAARPPAPAAERPLWLTLAEAADYSGLSRDLLTRACKASALKSFKRGGWRINREALEQFDPTAVEIPRKPRQKKKTTGDKQNDGTASDQAASA